MGLVGSEGHSSFFDPSLAPQLAFNCMHIRGAYQFPNLHGNTKQLYVPIIRPHLHTTSSQSGEGAFAQLCAPKSNECAKANVGHVPRDVFQPKIKLTMTSCINNLLLKPEEDVMHHARLLEQKTSLL